MVSFAFLYLTFLLSFCSGGSVPIQPNATSGLPHCSWLPVPPLESNFSKTPIPPPEYPQLALNCELRKLGVDFWNYSSFSPKQVKSTTEAFIRCNSQLLFESILEPLQAIFSFTNLQSLKIEYCKIRRVPSRIWKSFSFLKNLTLRSHNGDWSGLFGLEIEDGSFHGLDQLESLDLAWNNIWKLQATVFCPLGFLERLNLSGNRLSEVAFGKKVIGGEPSESDCGLAEVLVHLDLSQNTIRRIGEKSLGKLSKLRELRLQHNQIEEIEADGLSGLNQLKLLNLSSNRLASLPTTLFKNNQLLSILNLGNNCIVELHGSEFESLQNLRELHLQSNQLQFIGNQTFHPLSRLEILVLENNRIENIHPQAFTNLVKLRSLDLSRNQLFSLDASTFQNLHLLLQLYLDHNKIRRLKDSAFVSNSKLRDLGLAGNLLSEVPSALRFRSALAALESLDLGENRIRLVTNESFLGLGHVYGLRLVANRIEELPSGFCNALAKLNVLNLAQNQISKISETTFSDCPNLKALRLDTNRLVELPVSLAPQLPSVLWLNVSKNRIRRADYRTLSPTIEWLDLSKNELVTFGREAATKVGPVKFQLRVLDISINNLTHLDSTIIPPKIEILRVNFNQLHTVAPDTFSNALRLRRVELMGNQLTSLPFSLQRLSVAEREEPLQIFARDNPFAWDCTTEWLTRVGQHTLLRQYPHIVDLDSIKCRSVSSRHTEVKALLDMNVTDCLCPYVSHCFALCQCCDFEACDCFMKCPDKCSCFHDSSWTTNIVECSNLNYAELPSRVPMDATEIYFDGNNFQELGNHLFIGKKNLRVLHLNASRVEIILNKTFNGLRALEILHLEDNTLKQLYGHEFLHLENLVELYVQYNLISSISPSTFTHLKFLQILRLNGNRLAEFSIWELRVNINLQVISIHENPWSCSCEFLIPFKTWIISKGDSVVMDYGLARCQPVSNSSWPRNEHQGFESPASKNTSSFQITPEWGIPIVSTCELQGERDITTYGENRIMETGGGEVIHHLHREMSSVGPESGNQLFETHGKMFWMISTTVGVILILILAAVCVFRVDMYLKCHRGEIENVSFSFRGTQRNDYEEKVGEDSSTFLSDSVTEDTKLFVYFLYNDEDEELLRQNVTPQLEAGPLRVLLHYRDLCQGGPCVVSQGYAPEEAWNPEMTLCVAEASKAVVIVLSKSFLQHELSEPVSRFTLQLLMQRLSAKVFFILLPPLNHLGLSTFFPEIRSNITILDWLDPNFWPKLRVLLPTPSEHRTAQEQRNEGLYNQSLNTKCRRNIMPYQIHVPNLTTRITGASISLKPNLNEHRIIGYEESTPKYTCNATRPPTLPNHIVAPLLLPTLQALGPTVSTRVPTAHMVPMPNSYQSFRPSSSTMESFYSSFADNFRFHQQQHHNSQNTNIQLRSSSPHGLCRTNAYRPLLLKNTLPSESHPISSPGSTTDDSGNVNSISGRSEELENEHFYSTLDSQLQLAHDASRPLTNDDCHPMPIASPQKRSMYFV